MKKLFNGLVLFSISVAATIMCAAGINILKCGSWGEYESIGFVLVVIGFTMLLINGVKSLGKIV